MSLEANRFVWQVDRMTVQHQRACSTVLSKVRFQKPGSHLIAICILFCILVDSKEAGAQDSVSKQAVYSGLSVTLSTPATNRIGKELILTVAVTNNSTGALTIRRFNSPWEWVLISDANGFRVPTKMAHDVKIAVETEESFVLLKPSEGVRGERTCKWVTDPQQRKTISPEISSEIYILDCGSTYAFLKYGKHAISFVKGSPQSTQLKKSGGWVSAKDVFSDTLFTGEIQSTPIEVEFVPPLAR